jgi:hypothetical protein
MDGMQTEHDKDIGPGFGLWAAMLIVLAIAACCIAGCGSETAGLPDDAYQAEADAVVALSFAAEPVLPGGDGANPKPSPDDDRLKPGQTCPDCRGSGKSGDGIGRCGTCGGDGKIDPEDIIRESEETGAIGDAMMDLTIPGIVKAPTKEIVLHVTKKNVRPWVQSWWREVGPSLEDDGFLVSVVTDNEGDHDQDDEPWFELFTGNERRVLHGEQPIEAFR